MATGLKFPGIDGGSPLDAFRHCLVEIKSKTLLMWLEEREGIYLQNFLNREGGLNFCTTNLHYEYYKPQLCNLSE